MDIPSPSTEFSKLDISLTNPCFDIKQFKNISTKTNENKEEDQQKRKQIDIHSIPLVDDILPKLSTGIENPVFNITLTTKHSKIKSLSKIKEATIEPKIFELNKSKNVFLEENKLSTKNTRLYKTKKERKIFNHGPIKPSFISYLDKEEFFGNLFFLNNFYCNTFCR
jgi:hypothetical protein